MTESDISKTDRRSKTRLAKRIPVRVRNGTQAEAAGQTRDLSTNGIFLYTQSRLIEGSDVELVLILPPELMNGSKSWVCCHARVVRVEPGPGTEFGIAAEIKRMQVLPEICS